MNILILRISRKKYEANVTSRAIGNAIRKKCSRMLQLKKFDQRETGLS